MTEHPRIVPGDPASGLLLIADHLSDHVPADIDLGIDPALLEKHIAVDIGIAALAEELRARLDCPAVHAGVSRLVVDLHRERANPKAIPVLTDGHAIPGNALLDEAGREARLERFWDPYHRAIEAEIDRYRPRMLFTPHSFTPKLETDPGPPRVWQVGILYNRDERAPRIAIPLLEARGLSVGDNEPYSGRELNATMNLHAERRGLPYLAIEIRNDLIGSREGARQWADIVAPVIAATRDALE
ncbi:MAG: N-formylglutamate amidohydrolase [Parasphingopyxis sp.]|nr:N-formylglutamate amidohydrolase [Sphingomonadales bacterium]